MMLFDLKPILDILKTLKIGVSPAHMAMEGNSVLPVYISDVVILPGLRSLDDVAGTGAPPDMAKTVK